MKTEYPQLTPEELNDFIEKEVSTFKRNCLEIIVIKFRSTSHKIK